MAQLSTFRGIVGNTYHTLFRTRNDRLLTNLHRKMIQRSDAEKSQREVTQTIRSWAYDSPSQRSASIAALQPDPAAVTAWRYVASMASPQAKTPGRSVWVD